MSPLFLFSILLGMNQTTYIEVLGWTQSNSYCLIFFTSGKLNKWTGSKCALGFKASVCSGTQRIWSTESEMESRSGLYGFSQGQVKGSVDHVRHLKKVRRAPPSWAEVFPASPVPTLSRWGTDLHRSPSSFSSPGSQLSRLQSSNIVKDIGAGIAHIKRNVGQRFHLQTYPHRWETVRPQGHDRSGHLKKWTDILIPHSCRHQQPSPWAKLEPTGIGTYAPNCLYKDIFHRTILL